MAVSNEKYAGTNHNSEPEQTGNEGLESRFAKLLRRMFDDQRHDEVKKVALEADFRDKLYEEYGI